MLNLMKYEIDRRKKAVIIFMAIVVVVQGLILFGLYRDGGWPVLSAVTAILLTIGTYLFVLFDSIRTYYSDLNSSEGYMLFLTPNSGYKIIASKLIIAFIELMLFVMVAVAFIILDYVVIKHLFIDTGPAYIREIFYDLADFYKALIPGIGQIFVFSFSTILQWFNVIMMAILAITLTKTLLSNKKYSWLISLGIFIAINVALQFLSMAVISSFGFYKDIMNLARMQVQVNLEGASLTVGTYPSIGNLIFKYTAIMTVLYAIYVSVFYAISGWLLDKRIDL